ncbi:MAG: SDR family oxidoreductase [Pseudomonadota bacterium]
MTRLAFITGASSGIGQAMAVRYAQAGWRLALAGRRTHEIEAWARAAGLPPQRWQVYQADVAQTDSIVAAGQACIASQGLPDVVIACAGISVGVDTAHREDLDVMARVFAVNQLGLAATFHPFVAPMRQRASGTLVGIASVAGVRGLPGHGAYCASKASVISYCESLRGELRASGVRVVTLSPGFVATPLTARNRYAMPFLLQPAAFADQAFVAIEAGVRHRVIPWQMRWVARLLRVMPDALFDRLMVGRPRKHRHNEG